MLGVAVVEKALQENFGRLTGAILDRYLRQNGLPPLSEEEIAGIADRLWRLVESRGLPGAAVDGGTEPPEMTAEEVAPLVAQVIDGLTTSERLRTPLRQLVKACFQAVRRTCRESYRAAAADGVCRRQVRERVRERISGTHCVDCPYWTEFGAAEHAAFLASAWRPEGAGEFAAQREVFLPEDFRALRALLRDLAPR